MGHRRVIAYNTTCAGHGRSPGLGPRTPSPQHTARDLDEVLEAAHPRADGVDRATGGVQHIVLEYAAGHGGRVTALGLLEAAAAARSPSGMLAKTEMEMRARGTCSRAPTPRSRDWPWDLPASSRTATPRRRSRR